MEIEVSGLSSPVRLDKLLSDLTELSRSAAARLCEEGAVLLNGKAADKKATVKNGDVIEYALPEPEPSEVLPENIPIDIVYEDEYVIVINKPKGMVVHPAPGNYTGTLVNALLYHCGDTLSGIGGVVRPGIVHRIDKDTSGLLVVAKCDKAHTVLSDSLKSHGIEREYHALVAGGFTSDRGTVNLPIGRHPTDRKRMAVLPRDAAGAREAITHYEVLARYGQVTYLKLNLETGRTHQIRVHMSHTGHPLLGDEVYQKNITEFEKRHKSLFSGQALHARRLSFIHPITGESMVFECELPGEFKKALEILEKSV